ncbi:50S ribosomal protein L3 N(5)-glutamine methyltransferase [Echinimonas agarilytica]|uniref:Ribosomal protein uL3 glutamine methyltransferase n=1 Tax=Echinimonas agarilytica TaxID=1215918 RepID=A0AA41W5Y9_9GAMM|nr:50S ribosomal protein L3 N(5)-glutamine methyltransferase [Echinimonas agarilytica]MCM2679232.1 50S ribosomal protein L3 N(5)-glutamine methyltransferase [Echinimonas agarilytica]
MDKNIIEEAVAELSTIQDLLRWATSQFNGAAIYLGHGTDNAWDEAVALVTHALHLPGDVGHEILTARLTRTERQAVVDLILLRIERRLPLPYLTNKAWFAGLPFYVDERVLIPRSPVAEMIEHEFQPWLKHVPERILDLCTGSGCIAIALAHAFPAAEVDAVDISADALAVAEINISEYGLNERVFPMESDCFDALSGTTYDLIVSNPPYVDAEDMADLPEEYQHEPELALAAGHDGLDLVRRMLREAPDHLAENGLLVCEVGNSQVHMQHAFPDVPFIWIEFQNGGDGIFVIDRNSLLTHRAVFG